LKPGIPNSKRKAFIFFYHCIDYDPEYYVTLPNVQCVLRYMEQDVDESVRKLASDILGEIGQFGFEFQDILRDAKRTIDESEKKRSKPHIFQLTPREAELAAEMFKNFPNDGRN